jgi:beta-glucosidase
MGLSTRSLIVLATSVALGLAQSNTTTSTNGTSSETSAYFEELERFWSYGRSEPVYPTPNVTELPLNGSDWADSINWARAVVANLTLAEKANLTLGFASTPNGCSGKSGSLPRIGYEGMCLNNAGNGVGGTDGVNAYPAALHMGASWNRQLAYDRSLYMGQEFKRKGVNIALGPAVGPLGRLATGGRYVTWAVPNRVTLASVVD